MSVDGLRGSFRWRSLQLRDVPNVLPLFDELFPVEVEEQPERVLQEAVSSSRWVCVLVEWHLPGNTGQVPELAAFVLAALGTADELKQLDSGCLGGTSQCGGAWQPCTDAGALLMYVCHLGVRERFRRRGLATQLLALARSFALQRRCHSMYLHTLASGTAEGLYARAGFVRLASVPRFYRLRSPPTTTSPAPASPLHDNEATEMPDQSGDELPQARAVMDTLPASLANTPVTAGSGAMSASPGQAAASVLLAASSTVAGAATAGAPQVGTGSVQLGSSGIAAAFQGLLAAEPGAPASSSGSALGGGGSGGSGDSALVGLARAAPGSVGSTSTAGAQGAEAAADAARCDALVLALNVAPPQRSAAPSVPSSKRGTAARGKGWFKGGVDDFLTSLRPTPRLCPPTATAAGHARSVYAASPGLALGGSQCDARMAAPLPSTLWHLRAPARCASHVRRSVATRALPHMVRAACPQPLLLLTCTLDGTHVCGAQVMDIRSPTSACSSCCPALAVQPAAVQALRATPPAAVAHSDQQVLGNPGTGGEKKTPRTQTRGGKQESAPVCRYLPARPACTYAWTCASYTGAQLQPRLSAAHPQPYAAHACRPGVVRNWRWAAHMGTRVYVASEGRAGVRSALRKLGAC